MLREHSEGRGDAFTFDVLNASYLKPLSTLNTNFFSLDTAG